MRYVLFDEYNTADLGLLYLQKSIGSPKLKNSTVTIPGGDGLLDYTDFFGGPRYGNRTLKVSFASTVRSYTERMQLDSEVMNALHGKRMRIVFDDDPEFYYVGRVTVGDWVNDEGHGRLTITVDAYPWKRRLIETKVSRNGSGRVLLQNLKMPATPRVTVTAAATLTWTGHSVSLDPGAEQLVPSLTLGAGTTEVTVETTGTVTFVYREGGF